MSAILLLTGFLLSIFVFLKYRYSYWQRRGIPQPTDQSVLQTLVQTRTLHNGETAKKLYKPFKGKLKVIGDYLYVTPVIMALDLEVIKHVLIKDFNYFPDRNVHADNDQNDPLSKHLFRETGEAWRTMRAKLSPTFSSGKMKSMFPLVMKVANQLTAAYASKIKASKNGILEIYDISSCYTTDVIANCIFGADCNSLMNPTEQFRIVGREVFEKPFRFPRFRAIGRFYTKYFKLFGWRAFNRDILAFIIIVVTETVEARDKHKIKRNDFMDLLIELRDKKDEKGNPGLTMSEIASQAFVFYAAGFETSSSLMTFCLYELARHQDVQDKLRAEIKEHLAKNNGEFQYESFSELTYLGQVLAETMRIYPAFATLQRVAVRDYKVPSTNVVIPKGTTVIIPLKEIHHDPEFWPEPEQFRPDRFLPEEIQKRHPQSYLAFGDGPRNCIGVRFGRIQSRVGIANLINKFKFTTCTETPTHFDPPVSLLLQIPDRPVYLKVEEL